MRLESGPAKVDALWQLGRTILFLGFAGYFCYDGLVGYPLKNQTAAEAALQARPFDGKLTFEKLAEAPTNDQFTAALKTKLNVEQLKQTLGEPTFTEGSDLYYVTRYGYGRVSVQGSSWNKWPNGGRDKEEIRVQLWFGMFFTLVGLFFVYRFVRAVALRVTLDDEGMTYAGRRIAYADIVSLRDYSPKGWIDLYYRAGEKEQKLRLDNEKVKRFDEIVDAICQAKGYSNQVREHAARKAGEPSGEQPAG